MILEGETTKENEDSWLWGTFNVSTGEAETGDLGEFKASANYISSPRPLRATQ